MYANLSYALHPAIAQVMHSACFTCTPVMCTALSGSQTIACLNYLFKQVNCMRCTGMQVQGFPIGYSAIYLEDTKHAQYSTAHSQLNPPSPIDLYRKQQTSELNATR